MQMMKPVGRSAAVRKYDILTALGALALAGSKHDQRRTLRLMTLITARYNWQSDLLAVGQREIARMWSCDERTVKREMMRLKAMGWLVMKRQGARGRVSEYGLGLETILSATRSHWMAIGPDFEARMTPPAASESQTVVPFPGNVAAPVIGDESATEWDMVRLRLHRDDPGLYGAWVEALTRQSRAGDRLILRAPSRFHASYVITHLVPRLLAMCQELDPSIRGIDIGF